MSERAIVHLGDCREVLKRLAADGLRVDTCITSPPYFGLRDYGTGTWSGGDAECDHVEKSAPQSLAKCADRFAPRAKPRNPNAQDDARINDRPYRGTCGKCGAERIDKQLGAEKTPAEFVANLVEVFRGVRDVLADDGTVWLNLGDSYASSGGHTAQGKTSQRNGRANVEAQNVVKGFAGGDGLKTKDLIGIPWRVAFALQADGWYLRQDIIWSKPNPMPESVTDRCTKSHEYIFLLSKRARYWYDAEAIAEALGTAANAQSRGPKDTPDRGPREGGNGGLGGMALRIRDGDVTTRNKRSVWTVPTYSFPGAHFATFPPKLIEPCVLAGSRVGGIVLDPFTGSGTTALVALEHDRRFVGVELSPEYHAMAEKRIELALAQCRFDFEGVPA